jgi:hypothetical protein
MTEDDQYSFIATEMGMQWIRVPTGNEGCALRIQFQQKCAQIFSHNQP